MHNKGGQPKTRSQYSPHNKATPRSKKSKKKGKPNKEMGTKKRRTQNHQQGHSGNSAQLDWGKYLIRANAALRTLRTACHGNSGGSATLATGFKVPLFWLALSSRTTTANMQHATEQGRGRVHIFALLCLLTCCNNMGQQQLLLGAASLSEIFA